MPNPTTITDLEDRFRPLTNEEGLVAQTLLLDAWWLLLARRPSLEADLTAGLVSEANVVRVISAMVIRILRNPEGFAEEGIGSYRYRRDEMVASGALHVTPAELADLTPSGHRRTRSVRLVAYGETT